jgi:hypothetical protein
MYNITNDIIKLVKPRFESIWNILIPKKYTWEIMSSLEINLFIIEIQCLSMAYTVNLKFEIKFSEKFQFFVK